MGRIKLEGDVSVSRLEKKLVVDVSVSSWEEKKLECDVSLSRWEEKKYCGWSMSESYRKNMRSEMDGELVLSEMLRKS